MGVRVPLQARVTAHKVLQEEGKAQYCISVSHGTTLAFKIWRRFSQFRAFRDELISDFSEVPSFPSRTLLTNLDEQHLQRRAVALDEFLLQLTERMRVSTAARHVSPCLLAFSLLPPYLLARYSSWKWIAMLLGSGSEVTRLPEFQRSNWAKLIHRHQNLKEAQQQRSSRKTWSDLHSVVRTCCNTSPRTKKSATAV
jgi:hypothetical protein